MKSSIVLFCVLTTFCAGAKTIASFKKKGAKATQKISLEEVQTAYQVIIRSTLNAPSPQKFVKDYVRYRVAVEEAYNDSSLVKTPRIRKMLLDAGLKESFEQVLYKAFAEKKMKSKLSQIDKETKRLSTAQLRNFYNKNPYYSFQYVVLSLSPSAGADQIRGVKARAEQIYNKIKKSKKDFSQLTALYSDNPLAGRGLVYHSRSTLYPLLYQALQKMKPGALSRPVQTPNGFYVLKLNQILDFKQANKEDIKSQYFSDKRSQVLNQYFNQLQAKYNISVNQKAVLLL